jgi:hypothetical protein
MVVITFHLTAGKSNMHLGRDGMGGGGKKSPKKKCILKDGGGWQKITKKERAPRGVGNHQKKTCILKGMAGAHHPFASKFANNIFSTKKVCPPRSKYTKKHKKITPPKICVLEGMAHGGGGGGGTKDPPKKNGTGGIAGKKKRAF